MPTLLDIRRRVRSVKNTQQITRAMKMVAAARLRGAQERIFNARPYANQMLTLLSSLAARTEQRAHPLLAERPVERILLVLITADRGLCGAFNANLLRAAQNYLEENRDRQVSLVTVGRKGRDHFRRRPVKLTGEYVGVFSHLQFNHAQEIAKLIIDQYTQQAVDAVDLLYNEFKSVLTQRVRVERYLPLKPLEPAAGEPRTSPVPARVGPPETPPSGARYGASTVRGVGEAVEQGAVRGEALIDYIYEQPPEEIFNVLLPRYVETEVYRALLESQAAELAAKMTAMDTATNNATEMIDSLTLHMNRVRQAGITREIIEVVSGAAAQ